MTRLLRTCLAGSLPLILFSGGPLRACDALPQLRVRPPGSPAVPEAVTTAMRTSQPSYCLYGDLEDRSIRRLLLYLHGYGHGSTTQMDALLQYLAVSPEGELEGSGLFVVYPTDLGVLPNGWLPRAEAALDEALSFLSGRSIEIAEVAFGGFSAGGITAANLAARWGERSPPLRSLVLQDPAGLRFFTLEDLSRIPPSTRLLVIQAEATVGDDNSAAEAIWNQTGQIPLRRGEQFWKNFLLVPSDRSHEPIVASEHLTILAGGEEAPFNHLDYYGYWRPLHRAVWQSFLDTPLGRASAFCNDEGPCEVRFMGRWQSDDVPATPAKNAYDLGKLDPPRAPE